MANNPKTNGGGTSMKKSVTTLLIFFSAYLIISGLGFVLPAGAQESKGKTCVECHTKATPGIVGQWQESKHNQAGVG
jgi:hypothetical protein